jgi:hypothetical protein
MDPWIYITVGFVQTMAILGGGAVFMLKAGKSAGRVETLLSHHTDSIAELASDLKQIQPILAQIAVQKSEIANLTKWYDELRHGEGYVFPLSAHLQQKVPR